MVVGITIATITVLLLGDKKGKGPTFIDPDSFRDVLPEAIQNPARLESAITIVDSMKRLVEEYDDFLRTSINMYLKRIPDFRETAPAIFAEVIRPVEQKRRATLLAYVGMRDELRQVGAPRSGLGCSVRRSPRNSTESAGTRIWRGPATFDRPSSTSPVNTLDLPAVRVRLGPPPGKRQMRGAAGGRAAFLRGWGGGAKGR